jgi:hypothetical protein
LEVKGVVVVELQYKFIQPQHYPALNLMQLAVLVQVRLLALLQQQSFLLQPVVVLVVLVVLALEDRQILLVVLRRDYQRLAPPACPVLQVYSVVAAKEQRLPVLLKIVLLLEKVVLAARMVVAVAVAVAALPEAGQVAQEEMVALVL